MVQKLSRFSLGSIIFLGLSLAACDAPANEDAVVEQDLPVVSAPAATPSVADEGGIAEDPPGGGDVTEQEIPPQSDVPPPSRSVFVDTECDFETWVGQPVDEGALKQIDRPYRILAPGSMMTMDHNPERVNMEHDENNIVTRVWCG